MFRLRSIGVTGRELRTHTHTHGRGGGGRGEGLTSLHVLMLCLIGSAQGIEKVKLKCGAGIYGLFSDALACSARA
jgi:hypothetical protein